MVVSIRLEYVNLLLNLCLRIILVRDFNYQLFGLLLFELNLVASYELFVVESYFNYIFCCELAFIHLGKLFELRVEGQVFI